MSEKITFEVTDQKEEITFSFSEAARGPQGEPGAAATVDQTIIDGSANAVSGNAVFDGLALKAPLANPTFTGIVTAPRITGRCDGLEVFCKASLAINAGQVVYVTGASGNNIIIGLAQANAELTSSKTIGISESTLANNATGYVITEGLMTVSISAPSAIEGDPIWLSPSTAGGMVFGAANKPVAPNHMVYLGVVTRKTGNNVVEIYVKIQNGSELDELADVLITSLTAGQALMRGATNWENRSLVATDISDSTTAGRALLTAADAAAQRTSLGLGTAATTASTDYATAAQGALADSAVQPGDLATVATTGAYADLSGTPTLGNSAALNVGTTAGTVAAGDDARLSDERVPTAAGLTTKFGTAKATPVDADKVAILDSAASDAPKHSTLTAIWTWIQSKFAGASSKTTPIDADSFNIVDSADSNAAKRVTGTNLKAFLKTYLDTLYVALTGDQTIAGAKAFSSTTRPTSSGTGTPASNSLITQEDSRNDRFLNIGSVGFLRAGTPVGVQSGTGTNNSRNQQGWLLRSGTSTSGYSFATLANAFDGVAGARLSRKVKLAVSINIFEPNGATDTLGCIRVMIGAPSVPAAANDAAFTTHGCGIEIRPDGTDWRFRIICHNGSTYTTGSWVVFATGSIWLENYGFIVSSDATGNVSASVVRSYGNTTLYTSSSTGGPTNYTADGQYQVAVVNDSTGSPASTAVYLKDYLFEIKP